MQSFLTDAQKAVIRKHENEYPRFQLSRLLGVTMAAIADYEKERQKRPAEIRPPEPVPKVRKVPACEIERMDMAAKREQRKVDVQRILQQYKPSEPPYQFYKP